MIFITGDMHSKYERFDEYDGLNENDTVIVCGDFGFVFLNDEDEQETLDLLAKKPYTICFIDGNHENFPAIFSYPEEVWNGGRIHRIRKNVIHLMRGQVFTIEDTTFFTMGGAYSVDRPYRMLNYSYWEEEIPTDEEYNEAVKNLEKANKKVDYVLSHTAPREIIRRMGYEPLVKDMELTGFLEWVMYEVDYQKWMFGHWHEDRILDDKFRALYTDIAKVE